MTKIQKTIDGKTYDFWKYTEEEIENMKKRRLERKERQKENKIKGKEI